MNCLIIYPEELSDSKAVISGERKDLLIERHGLAQGVELKAGIFGGLLGTAKILSVGEALELEFLPQAEPPARLPVILICGLCRPQTVKKVIQASVLFGINQLHFVRTEAGEKSYLDSKIWEAGALKREIELGLEQAVDTEAPSIKLHPRFHEFIHDELSGFELDKFACVLADTLDAQSGGGILTQKPVILAVGPEAGWTDKEREVFLEQGFQSVSLGERMLRVETAVSGFLGAIQAGRSA